MKQKTIHLEGVGDIVLVKNPRASRYSISISSSLKVRVSIPWLGTFLAGERLAKENRSLIVERMEKVREKLQTRAMNEENADIAGLSPEQAQAYVRDLNSRAHKVLPLLLRRYADQIGVDYNRLYIKHNRSNWGSCSVRRNINLNLNLMRLPEDLRAYVILHELTHLRYMNHGPQFHVALQDACVRCISPDADEVALSRRLRKYRLI